MKERIGTVLTVIYFLFFLGYTYPKINHMTNYMLLFKALMFIALLSYYFVMAKKINLTYILMFFLYAFGDLSGIYGGAYDNFSLHSFFVGNIVLVYMINIKIQRYATTKTFFNNINKVSALLSFIYILFALFLSFKFEILGFALLLTLLLYISYCHYVQSVKKSSFLMLSGVISLIVCNIFTAINQFLLPYKYYSLLDGVTYAIALYLITKAIVVEDNDYLEITE